MPRVSYTNCAKIGLNSDVATLFLQNSTTAFLFDLESALVEHAFLIALSLCRNILRYSESRTHWGFMSRVAVSYQSKVDSAWKNFFSDFFPWP